MKEKVNVKRSGNNLANFVDHPINLKIVIQGNIPPPKIIIIYPAKEIQELPSSPPKKVVTINTN